MMRKDLLTAVAFTVVSIVGVSAANAAVTPLVSASSDAIAEDKAPDRKVRSPVIFGLKSFADAFSPTSFMFVRNSSEVGECPDKKAKTEKEETEKKKAKLSGPEPVYFAF